MRPTENWQKTDPDLRTHPRFCDLVQLLETTPLMADGLLSGLWRMAYRQAEDGDLGRFSARQLAAGAGWPGDPEKMMAALVESGFLTMATNAEGRVGAIIHAWDEWGGALFAFRAQRAEAKRHERAKADNPAQEVSQRHSGDVAATSYAGRSVSSRTERERESKSVKSKHMSIFEKDFSAWWEVYGKTGSRADALLMYTFWRQEGATPEDLTKAATNYRAQCERANSIQMHGRTFLAKTINRWEEWVTPDLETKPTEAEQRRVDCCLCHEEVTPAQRDEDAVWSEARRAWAHKACAAGARRVGPIATAGITWQPKGMEAAR